MSLCPASPWGSVGGQTSEGDSHPTPWGILTGWPRGDCLIGSKMELDRKNPWERGWVASERKQEKGQMTPSEPWFLAGFQVPMPNCVILTIKPCWDFILCSQEPKRHRNPKIPCRFPDFPTWIWIRRLLELRGKQLNNFKVLLNHYLIIQSDPGPEHGLPILKCKLYIMLHITHGWI